MAHIGNSDNMKTSPPSAPNSPTRGGLSSGSEDPSEDWASCEGDLGRWSPSHSSSSPPRSQSKAPQESFDKQQNGPDGIQTRSALIQRLEREVREGGDRSSSEDLTAASQAEFKENVDEISELSQTRNREGTKAKSSPFHILRNASYQRAMSNKSPRPLSVPGILRESSPAAEALIEAEENPNVGPRRSPSPISAPTPAKGTSLLSPSLVDGSSGVNIGRSVSFNDRLLESPKVAQSPELRKASLAESNSSPATPSAPIRRPNSTPGSIHVLSKASLSTPSSPDANFPREPFSEGAAGGRRSIRTLTTSFARKLSFRKYKGAPKPAEEKIFDTNMQNGMLPPENGVVSYQGLLRLFECPGCQSLMVPPLLQCNKGHLVCEKCRSSFKSTCPICKQRVTGTTNYMMEQVCNLVKFPCQFGKFGCPEYHPPKQKTDHEHFCIFRPVSCHFASLGCEFILPLKDMNSHISFCLFKSKDREFKV